MHRPTSLQQQLLLQSLANSPVNSRLPVLPLPLLLQLWCMPT